MFPFTTTQQYVEKIIVCFNKGTLDAPAGVTLRSYLSEKLNCDPMRITKKFTGTTAIGKRLFTPINRNNLSEAEVRMDKVKLATLETKWRIKMSANKLDNHQKAFGRMNMQNMLHHEANRHMQLQQKLQVSGFVVVFVFGNVKKVL